jgi:hypothetical protein
MVWDDAPPDDEAAHRWAFALKADITGSPTQLLRGHSEPEAVETWCGNLVWKPAIHRDIQAHEANEKHCATMVTPLC